MKSETSLHDNGTKSFMTDGANAAERLRRITVEHRL